MIKEKTKLLPLGTVVKLEELDELIAIMGYNAKTNNNEKIYDYIGCLYPTGVISNDSILMFNKELIEKIIFYGFTDEIGEKFRKEIENNKGE